MLDPYKTLEVSHDASPGEIKKAYFRQIKHYPPETEPEKFKEIRAAYEKLRTNKVRIETDMKLIRPPESDFQAPSPEYSQYKSTITKDDIFNIIIAIYSDFNKTDFRDDYSDISF
jgi:curved DNA-binding protein CbpA